MPEHTPGPGEDWTNWEPPGGWSAINEPGGQFVSPAIYRYAKWARQLNADLLAALEKITHEYDCGHMRCEVARAAIAKAKEGESGG